MFLPDQYLPSLIEKLKAAFGERLCYAGLQGSYLRGEATEHSDIDIMTVVDNMTVADLDAYREAILSLPDADRSCGFICGREELLHWNPLEICHLVHTTKDYYGVLAGLVPAYTEYDVRAYIKMSLGNLYHEICHRYVHASMDENVAALAYTYRQVFFILQNLHYLESGHFAATRKELLQRLSGKDRQVLEAAVALGRGASCDFDAAFSLLFCWLKDTLVRTSSLAGVSLPKQQRSSGGLFHES